MAIAGKGQAKNDYPYKKKYIPRRFARLALFLLLCVLPGTCASADLSSLPYYIQAFFCRADADAVKALPGKPVDENAAHPELFLAVTVVPVNEGAYLYASKSQVQGKPTEVAAVAANGAPAARVVVFPASVEKADPLRQGETTRGYEGRFTVLLPITAKDLSGGDIRVKLVGLACSAANCTPLDLRKDVPPPDFSALGSLPAAASFPWWNALRQGVVESAPDLFSQASVASAAPRIPATAVFGVKPFTPPDPGVFLKTINPVPFSPSLEPASLSKALIFGFLAGIILNLMPCVLPVLGIKLGALLRGGVDNAEGARVFKRHQIFFALGILAWFTLLAGIFHWLGLAWGQIFQSPGVVFGLAVLLLLLALNLFGALSLPLIDFRAGNPKHPDAEAFVGGFTATLLATPCGGPLLGGVLSWAFMQPLGVMALTLESVGLGMAFPYLLLALFPNLASRLPKPGAWMGVMEQALGFLLLGTVAYLVGFLPAAMLPRAIGALAVVAFGGWVWGKGGYAKPAIRAFLRAAGAGLIVAACFWPLREQRETVFWTEYSHEAFGEELGKRMLLVDFTADWCPTCKVVEATALTETALSDWKKRYDLKAFRVDMTRSNPEGEALLRALGSVSIPVVAVFSAGEEAGEPFILRDLITKGQAEAALKAAGKRREEKSVLAF